MKIVPKFIPQHFQKGRKRQIPEIIVIHIGEGTFEQIYSTFLHEEKSAHYCVDFDGTIYQFVKEEDTAWHAGIVDRPTSEIVKSKLQSPNLYSIGIEHAGFRYQDLTPAQYQATSELLLDISRRYNIPLERRYMLRHEEIRKSKTCPGKADVGKLIDMARNFTKPPPGANLSVKPPIKEPMEDAPNWLKWFNDKINGK